MNTNTLPKPDKYLFSKLLDLKVKSAYLYKRNIQVSALYKENALVGCMQQPHPDFILPELATSLQHIFPKTHLEESLNPTVCYQWSPMAKKVGLRQIDKLWNIEPIVVHLQKTDNYLVGLYYHQHLIGITTHYQQCRLTLPEIAPHIDTLFPRDINHIENFAAQNPTVGYYTSTDIHYYDTEGIAISPTPLSTK